MKVGIKRDKEKWMKKKKTMQARDEQESLAIRYLENKIEFEPQIPFLS